MKKTCVKFMRVFALISISLVLMMSGACSDNEANNKSPEPKAPDGLIGIITIDSYSSDVFYKTGYIVEIGGVRFPLPTTLNDLGDKWRFGDNVGLIIADFYLEGKSTPLSATPASLYFNDVFVATVLVRDYSEKNATTAQIISIAYGTDSFDFAAKPKLSVNDIVVGSDFDKLDSIFGGKGELIKMTQSKHYRLRVGEYSIVFSSYENSFKHFETPSKYANPVTLIDVRLSISERPNKDYFDDYYW